MKKIRQAVIGSALGKLTVWVLLVVMLPAIVEELFELNRFLSMPFGLLADWNTGGTLEGRIKFLVLFVL